MDIELTTPPDPAAALDIVSVAEQKRHMRVASNTRDDEVEAAIRAAVAYLDGREGILNRSILPCTWTLYGTGFGDGPIELPYPPLIEVTGVGYIDVNGANQIFDPAKYIVRTHGLLGTIELLPRNSWPAYSTHPRAVAIEYMAGYQVPTHNLKRLVKILAAHFYENAEATINEPKVTATNRMVQLGFDHLVSVLRVPFNEGN